MGIQKKELIGIKKFYCYAFFQQSAHFLYGFLIHPKSIGEDLKRKEFILNIILLASVLLLSLLNLFTLYFYFTLKNDYTGVPIPIFLGILLIFIVLYIFSRLGWFVQSSYILVGIYFFSISFAAFSWGIDLPTALLGYAMLIVVASILVSSRFGLLLTLIIALFIIFLNGLESSGMINPMRDWKTQPLQSDDAIQYSFVLIVIAVVSWLSNREIERSLKRARASETALKEQRDILEITVEERTRELRETQQEKIAQLTKFSDFGRMASGLFHDLMNPLTSIGLYLEKVNKMGTTEITEAQSYLNKAFDASKRIDSLTQAMRRQLQERATEEWFSINEGIRQAIQIISHKAARLNVEVVFHAGADIATFDNPLKLHQVIVNLLSNAIDSYSDIALSDNRRREVIIALQQVNDRILVTIQDWGIGIAESDQKKIFEPFYTTKPTMEGMGIGLSTAKDIVEKDLQGKISFDSRKGEGTQFHISFPRHEDKS